MAPRSAARRGEGILPLFFRVEGMGTPNAMNRVWEPFPSSNRGHELAPAQAGDARDTQGQDALATRLGHKLFSFLSAIGRLTGGGFLRLIKKLGRE